MMMERLCGRSSEQYSVNYSKSHVYVWVILFASPNPPHVMLVKVPMYPRGRGVSSMN